MQASTSSSIDCAKCCGSQTRNGTEITSTVDNFFSFFSIIIDKSGDSRNNITNNAEQTGVNRFDLTQIFLVIFH